VSILIWAVYIKGRKKKVDEHFNVCVYHTLKPFILQTQKTIADLFKDQQKQLETIKEQQKEILELRQLIDHQEQEIKQLKTKQSSEHVVMPLQQSNSDIMDNSKYSSGGLSSGGLWNRLFRFIDPRDS